MNEQTMIDHDAMSEMARFPDEWDTFACGAAIAFGLFARSYLVVDY